MAKRFTDTEKWKKEWFRKLPLKMKAAWEYLRDNCDHAGIFAGDFELMSFQLGASITPDECVQWFTTERFCPLKSGKFFLPSFIEFQYGDLNPANRTHRSVILILEKEGASKGLTRPLQGRKDTGSDTDTGTDKEPPQKKTPITNDQVRACAATWLETLCAFGVVRKNITQAEETAIAQAIQAHGAEHVDLALYGARHEKKSDRFDPADHVSIDRILKRSKDGKERLDKFANLGAQAKAKKEKLPNDLNEESWEDLEKRLRGGVA